MENSLVKQGGNKKKTALIVTAFIINALIMIGIFLLAIYVNGTGEGAQSFTEYFETNFVQFLYLVIMLVFIVAVSFFFIVIENRSFLRSLSNVQMVFSILEITLLLCYFAGRYVGPYFRPIILGTLLLLLLVNRRTALFFNFTISLIIFLMDVFTNCFFEGSWSEISKYSSLMIGFTAGALGVYLIEGVGSRIKVFLRAMILVFPQTLCVLLLERDIVFNEPMRLVSGVGGVLFTVALFTMILPLFESMFKKLTDYRLSELCSHSSPIIRQLISEAPGTFNHSLVVSNLAEACAIEIGENPLLARCVAYYHDVGKLKQPEFFKENQHDGNNPHDNITPELSVNIIKAHAKDGYDLLRKKHYPAEIADICLQHHGTMPIFYFYAKAKNFADGEEVDIEKYSYQGPKPKTKIAAIIMIADSSEAVARALKDRSRESVDKAVFTVIEDRMKLRQFDDCDITMKELNVIRNTLVNALSGIYHKRVEYPTVDLNDFKQEEDE